MVSRRYLSKRPGRVPVSPAKQVEPRLVPVDSAELALDALPSRAAPLALESGLAPPVPRPRRYIHGLIAADDSQTVVMSLWIQRSSA